MKEQQSFLFQFWKGACSYGLNGRIPLGPSIHRLSNCCFWFFLLVIMSVYCIFTIPYLWKNIDPLLCIAYFILLITAIFGALRTQYTDGGRIPRRLLLEKVKYFKDHVSDFDDFINIEAYSEIKEQSHKNIHSKKQIYGSLVAKFKQGGQGMLQSTSTSSQTEKIPQFQISSQKKSNFLQKQETFPNDQFSMHFKIESNKNMKEEKTGTIFQFLTKKILSQGNFSSCNIVPSHISQFNVVNPSKLSSPLKLQQEIQITKAQEQNQQIKSHFLKSKEQNVNQENHFGEKEIFSVISDELKHSYYQSNKFSNSFESQRAEIQSHLISSSSSKKSGSQLTENIVIEMKKYQETIQKQSKLLINDFAINNGHEAPIGTQKITEIGDINHQIININVLDKPKFNNSMNKNSLCKKQNSTLTNVVSIPNQLNLNICNKESISKIKLYRGRSFCETCQIFRPIRSSHCTYCDCCIEVFDHHCQLLNTCIGKRNYKFFFLFISSFLITLILQTTSQIIYVINKNQSSSLSRKYTRLLSISYFRYFKEVEIAFNIIYIMILSLCLTYNLWLCIFHYNLRLKSLTSMEYFKKESTEEPLLEKQASNNFNWLFNSKPLFPSRLILSSSEKISLQSQSNL